MSGMKYFLPLLLFGLFFGASYDEAYGFYKSGDLNSALPLFRELCDSGDAVSCFSAASVLKQIIDGFEKGDDPDKEVKIRSNSLQMLDLFAKSCRAGYADGCNNYAYYTSSIGFDDPTHKKLEGETLLARYKQACDSGSITACDNLAIMYQEQGNLDGSLGYFDISCKSGNSYSCLSLGDLYVSKRDFSNAFKFYNMSCDMGAVEGCSNVGVLYERGDIEDTNYLNSLRYYSKACSMSRGQACSYLESLSSRLHKEQE